MFNDAMTGCVRGMADNDGGIGGGKFLGWAIFIGVNPGLTVAVTGVGSNVRKLLVWFGIIREFCCCVC